jgi:hypothetical protein
MLSNNVADLSDIRVVRLLAAEIASHAEQESCLSNRAVGD